MVKTYQHKNVTFGFSRQTRKWEFANADRSYVFLTHVPGGLNMAESVARLINGGLVRCKGKRIDNLTRTHLRKLFAEA